MKRTLLLSSLFASTLLLAETPATSEMSVKQEGVKYIKMLGGTLKKELVGRIQSDPTGATAMHFCAEEAQKITKAVNTKLPEHASVRRTALKLRNDNNGADAQDLEVMKAYEAKINAGTFSPKDIQVVEGETVTKVYKPLATAPVCLKCHGSNVSDEIQSKIKKYYPHDQATGFTKGSLRGVIVAEIKK